MAVLKHFKIAEDLAEISRNGVAGSSKTLLRSLMANFIENGDFM